MDIKKEITPRLQKADKAYNNRDFIHSRDGRTLRILSEYLYPEQYFRKYGIGGTVVFYGSARTLSQEEYDTKLKNINDKIAISTDENELKELNTAKIRHEKSYEMTKIYEEAVELSEMMAKWGMTASKDNQILVCTGGGPGMMEAANRGAARAGAKNIGLNISLPFEQYPNNYITPDLNFEFHYFFMRKFWFIYYTKAIVVLPGGFGTLDEMMEVLTLIQTTKVKKKVPIVLYNQKFWKNLINFEYLVETGMISPDDLDLFIYADTPQEAYNYLVKEIEV